MDLAVLSFIAFFLGFLTAIPIGACQIEVAKRSLHNHLLAAFFVIIGTVTSDVFYGIVALFGLAPFMENTRVLAFFELGCVVVLLFLAFLTLKQSAKPHITPMDIKILKSKRVAYVTGILLGVTNPLMLFWWLIGAKIIRDLGVIDTFTTTASVFFLIFGALGMIAYLFAVSMILHWAHKFITHKTIQRINLIFGFVLVGLAIYFLATSLNILL